MKKNQLILCCLISLSVFSKKVSVGGTGGYLDYPNATTTLSLLPGDTVAIKPGTYSGFTFGNIKSNSSKPIVITNDKGLVQITGSSSSYLRDVNNVILTGAGDVKTSHGFYFHDINNRALQLENRVDSVTISHCKFEKVSDYTVRINAGMTYNGTLATVLTKLKFLHLSFKSVSTPIDWGNFAYAADLIGVGQDVEIAYCDVDNLDGGDGFRLNKVFNVNIHHNRLTNTGLKLSSTHPGAIYVRGDGKLHHNYISNVWGNGMRLQGVGLNGTGALYVFNNIFLGSRKYSAVEVQTHPSDVSTNQTVPYAAPCNFYIDFNTMGNQSARDYSAGMVDVYSLMGAKCYIRNNLGFNIEKDKGQVANKNYVFNRQSPDLPDTANNLYKASYQELGLEDTLNCFLIASSRAIDGALTLAHVSDDFGGIIRNKGLKPDIGAREYDAVTAVTDEQVKSTTFGLFPNPASNILHIGSASIIQEVLLTDALGRLQASYSAIEALEAHLNLESLQNGFYFVTISTSEGKHTQSFIKQ